MLSQSEYDDFRQQQQQQESTNKQTTFVQGLLRKFIGSFLSDDND